MHKSELVAFMTNSQLREPLSSISRGQAATLPEWMKEGLQDRGLIDHRDQLTDAGRAIITQR